VRIEHTIIVNRPVDEVWTFLFDAFSTPRYLSWALRGWRWSGPIGVGTEARGRFTFMGFETDLTTTVTEYDPPRVIAHAMTRRLFRVKRRVTLRPTPDGTDYLAVTDIELRQPLKLLSPIIGRLFQRRAQADIQRLKELIEAGESVG
jgi:uncharacterized membrane protein